MGDLPDPELAQVGLTEAEVRRRGLKVRILRGPTMKMTALRSSRQRAGTSKC